MALYKVMLDEIASHESMNQAFVPVMLTEVDDFIVNMVAIEGVDDEERVHPDHDELFIGFKGNATILIDGDPVPLGEGDTVVVKKGQSHAARAESRAVIVSIKDVRLLLKEQS